MGQDGIIYKSDVEKLVVTGANTLPLAHNQEASSGNSNIVFLLFILF